MKTKNLVISSVFFLLSAAVSSAQKPHLFDSESGLPSSKVTSVIQDGKGFIWVATEGGLARFDGVDFTAFNDAGAGDGSTGSITLSLCEDSRGTFWIGTSQGLKIFDQKVLV